MKYKALVSFAGKISMGEGEVREISDERLANSLLQVHYIEKVEEPKKVKLEPPKEATKPVVKNNKKSKK